MTRRNFAASLLGAGMAAAQQRPAKPNILFILADDMGYGDLGCYGQERIRTPNIDRLAAEGVRFTQAYAGSTVCAPSRCCLMTGKHTGHATVRGNKKPEVGIRQEEATVASLLKSAGYRTALFGKWGLGGPGTGSVPNTRGFDSFYGYLDQQHAHNAYPEHLWNNQNEEFLTDNWFNRKRRFAPDLFTAKALPFLEQQSADPFFLYLTYTLPHANNELGNATKNGMEVPDQGIYASESWPDVEKNFAAGITRMDSDIGRILETLRSRNLDSNTLIVFTSDNGPHKEGGHNANFFRSSGSLRGTKRDLYEGGIRVPMIARWANTLASGKVSDAPWAFWDFLPTACELAGIRAPGSLDGRSVAPLLLQGQAPSRECFYWEFHEGGFQQAVRQGDWKLVRQAPKFAEELFNLKEDPAEKNDVAARYPDTAARMARLFESERVESKDFPSKPVR